MNNRERKEGLRFTHINKNVFRYFFLFFFSIGFLYSEPCDNTYYLLQNFVKTKNVCKIYSQIDYKYLKSKPLHNWLILASRRTGNGASLSRWRLSCLITKTLITGVRVCVCAFFFPSHVFFLRSKSESAFNLMVFFKCSCAKLCCR